VVASFAAIGGWGWFTAANDVDAEGIWEWSSEDAFGFTNWAPNEPNDWGGGEDCGVMFSWDGLWNDSRCDDDLSFVCEQI
jgi:hypothetical protein